MQSANLGRKCVSTAEARLQNESCLSEKKGDSGKRCIEPTTSERRPAHVSSPGPMCKPIKKHVLHRFGYESTRNADLNVSHAYYHQASLASRCFAVSRLGSTSRCRCYLLALTPTAAIMHYITCTSCIPACVVRDYTTWYNILVQNKQQQHSK